MGTNRTSVRIRDLSNGRVVWETAAGRDPAVFDNGGKLLVTAGRDKKSALLWENSKVKIRVSLEAEHHVPPKENTDSKPNPVDTN